MLYVYVVSWIFLHTFQPIFAYRQTVWTLIRLLLEQSDLGPHCLKKLPLKSQANDKADNNCCDGQFNG